MTEDTRAFDRRQKTKAVVVKAGIDFNDELSLVERFKTTKNIDDRCKRAIASLYVIQLASSLFEGDRDPDNFDIIKRYIKIFDVEKALLREEKKVLSGKMPFTELTNINWSYESFWVVLWSLGLIEDISDATVVCERSVGLASVRDCMDYNEFKSKCNMRSDAEVLDMLDLYYCYYYAINANQENSSVKIGKLNADVVKARLRGLEWLVRREKDWFELSLDDEL